MKIAVNHRHDISTINIFNVVNRADIFFNRTCIMLTIDLKGY